MSTRKEKAEKKKAERQKAVIKPQASTVNATPDTETPDPLVSLRHRPLNSIEAVQGEAVVPNPTAPQMTRRGDALTRVTPVQGQAVAMNQEQAGAPVNPATKPITLSDMLAEQRQNAIKDKTDAVKMQKYYALTDALGALGRMGGTAIGGAIGGDVLDGASNIPEYQPSRGYIDAFEKAKQANERLRALDDKEFQLAYNKQIKDEERAYKQRMAAIESELREAQAQKNFEREQELLNQKAQLDLEQLITRLNISHANEKELKEISERIVKLQMQGGDNNKDEKTTPVIFKDKSRIDMTNDTYNVIRDTFMNSTVDDMYVDETNVDRVIRDNPDLVKEYLVLLGLAEAPAVEHVQEVTEESAPKKRTFKERVEEYGKLTGGVVPQGTYNGFRYKNENNNTEDKSAEDESLEDYNAKFKSNRKR
jgi:hypothetical protein